MAICPSGHTSGSDDFCDTCGVLIPGAPRQSLGLADPDPASGPASREAGEAEEAEACPMCGTPRSGRFCEVDAYDFETGTVSSTAQFFAEPLQPEQPRSQPSRPSRPEAPPPRAPEGAAWTAVITADRAYYESVIAMGGPDAASIAFPPYCPERRVALAGGQVRIGRRSASRGIEPEIDLSVPPEDPGVSHLHAVLLARPDGTWELVDPGSMNGTTLNGGGKPVDVNVPVPVGDGDRIHVGAWTTITLSSRRPE
ncbi:FHA domain-containing protein [Spirillospora sp. NPDC029432]|uniref:FHA domain-containing protein n=1 Tax=Spirillospora sp. NPDC029432 TaxID=3154599 RepID=UPI0034522C94